MFLTRSPLGLPKYCYNMDPVRLACVKHAASVRPEPGSNSPSRTSFTSEGSVLESPWRMGGITPYLQFLTLFFCFVWDGWESVPELTDSSNGKSRHAARTGVQSSLLFSRSKALGMCITAVMPTPTRANALEGRIAMLTEAECLLQHGFEKFFRPPACGHCSVIR